MARKAKQGLTRTERRILVLAPSGRDGQLTVEVLRHQGLHAFRCASVEELCAELRVGAGAAILASEALGVDSRRTLLATLVAQPYWSDLPLLVLARAREDFGALHAAFSGLGNVTLLERPVPIATLGTTLQAALRARRRQYEVRDLVEQLRETDRRKDEFLAMLGHELRNPLGVMRTALELLASCTPPDAGRQVARIEHQIAHLTRMVDDLLDLSRVSRGRITLRRQPCELVQLAAAAVEAGGALREDRRIELRHPEEPLWVEGDPVRLEQVVVNLLHNALKYSPAEQPIEIELRREDGSAELRVKDHGIGIRPEELPRIFDTFIQLDRSLARSGGGLGLGLSLVRHLVRLHGGRVSARSAGPDLGSEFIIRLPLLPPHRWPQDAAGQDREVATQTSDGNGHSRNDPRSGRPPAGHAEDASWNRILLVEDLDDAREALAELLALHGYQVLPAEDGYRALEVARKGRPRIALVDIGLPGIDGYQVGRRLRASFGRELTLVAMTGYGQVEDRRRSREAGFDHHLVKPVDPGQLLALLREALPQLVADPSPGADAGGRLLDATEGEGKR
jgi:signal transduction histidine kinase/CheY-like chemotaxis protein